LKKVPDVASFTDQKGNLSFGFYIGLLRSEKWETAIPKAFFDLLKIDRNIGWTNDDHIEECIFFYKGIKIIEDQNVSFFFNFYFIFPKQCIFEKQK